MSKHARKSSRAAKVVSDWEVTLIASKGKPLGTVSAVDEAGAIAKAIDEFDIAPAFRKRLLVRRIRYV